MMERRAGLLTAAIAALAAGTTLLAGCSGREVTLTVTHYHPAAMPLPSTLRTLSIGLFISTSGENGDFAALAREALAAALSKPRGAERFHVLDSKHVTRRADGVVYGTVTVNLAAQSAPDAPATCLAEVTFNIVDLQTGRTVITSTISRRQPRPADARAKAKELLADCVDEFVVDITPHEESVRIVLAEAKDKIARKAAAMAADGKYDEALDNYKRALLQSGDDHGILFNAGVIHEIKGNLTRASGLYARSLQIEPKEKYREALGRVRKAKK